MRKLRYYLVMGAFALMAGALVLGIIRTIKGPDPAKLVIGISATDGYGEALEGAMKVWNGFVGCEFLVPGPGTIVKSDDGEPCGDAMRPEEEWGHAATAYDCRNGSFEILVSHPGNINTQTCIIAHEIGHRLKEWNIEHSTIGVMGRCQDPANNAQNILRIRDKDSASIRKFFCK